MEIFGNEVPERITYHKFYNKNEDDPDDVVIMRVADNLVEFTEMILEVQDVGGE